MDESDRPGAGAPRLAWAEQILMDQGDAICVLDLEDRITFVIRAAECLLDRPREELLGLSQGQVLGETAVGL
jgi:PAS domain-containing protein